MYYAVLRCIIIVLCNTQCGISNEDETMTTIERATAALFEAETSLRDVISDAAKDGEYDALRLLTNCASTLSGLRADLERNAGVADVRPIVNGSHAAPTHPLQTAVATDR